VSYIVTCCRLSAIEICSVKSDGVMPVIRRVLGAENVWKTLIRLAESYSQIHEDGSNFGGASL
jgi:hypothetical protein